MTYTQRQHGHHLILAFHGKLYNQLYAAEIEKTAHNHLAHFKGNLVLDLSQLGNINSNGINLLLKLLNSYKTDKRTVFIAGANSSVTGVLTITKLHTIFELVASIDEAISQNHSQNIKH